MSGCCAINVPIFHYNLQLTEQKPRILYPRSDTFFEIRSNAGLPLQYLNRGPVAHTRHLFSKCF